MNSRIRVWCQLGEDSPFEGHPSSPHEIPCPPADDALGFAVLRETGQPLQPYDRDASTGRPVTWMSWINRGEIVYAVDPLEAVILAAAEYVEKDQHSQ
jgi:hypothetical protein